MSTNWSGSPVGPYDQFNSVNNAAGATTVLIAAPGAGFCIYLQQIGVSNFTLGAGAIVNQIFETTAGQGIGELALDGGVVFSMQRTYPGGLKLPANVGLQVRNNSANASICSFSAAVGPAV